MKKILIAVAAVAIVACTAAVALATGDPAPSASASSGSTQNQPSREGRAGRRQFMLLHADGVAMRRDGTTVDGRMQKGIIQQVDSSSITLKSPDGFVGTYTIDDQTRVREERKPATASDLKQGDMARVVAVKDGDAYRAVLINCVGAPGKRLQQLTGAA